MKFLKQFFNISNIFNKKNSLQSIKLGRWSIETCSKKTNLKIDYSNEDHCGPCGQYLIKPNEKFIIK